MNIGMRSQRANPTQRILAGVVALGCTLFGWAGVRSAQADTVPDPASGLPATVSADVLPTVQINGVVWSTVTVGNTAYAVGDFNKSRPAGTAPGDPAERVAAGILAFDVTTGNQITSFNHTLNGPGRSVTASPDGSRLYVAGDFTSVDGQPRGHVAAFDIATGALVANFAPSLNAEAKGIIATNSTVYVGGSFTNANGSTRSATAAFSTTGTLLPWNPAVNGGSVAALTLSPDQSVVMVGGSFSSINGSSRYGIGPVNATSGANTAWDTSFPVRNSGSNAAITSLHTFGSLIYATAYSFSQGGTLEGLVAFDQTGKINFLNSCHGDHYDSFTTSGVTYAVSHAHDCSDPGAWEQTDPWTWHRAQATTSTATPGCVEAPNNNTGYTNFAGQPCATMLDWFPDVALGTYTGQSQGAWAVSGNTDYVVMGGEFPTINKTAQYGLARFAVKSLAPNKVGPIVNASLIPTVTSPRPNSLLARWTATWDRDNENLTYRVYRNNTLVGTLDQKSTFWQLPTMSFLDTGVTGGTSYTYRVTVTDPTGNIIFVGSSSPATAASGVSPTDAYGKAVYADAPDVFYRMDETSGTTTVDSSGLNKPGGYLNGPVLGASSTVAPPGTAVTFDGSNDTLATNSAVTAPSAFSAEVWFNSTTTRGGRLIGFDSSRTGSGSTYDRMVYLNDAGQLVFGTQTSSTSSSRATVTSADRYNDGRWHHVVATMSSGGMKLYVDSQLVGTATRSTAQSYSGYWRFGGGNAWGGTSGYFAGTLDEAAIYPTALTPTQVANHFAKSPAGDAPPVASFTTSVANRTVSFNASASTDPDGTITSYAWNFGDGTTGTGVTASRTYATAGTYNVSLTLTDDKGVSTVLTKAVTTNLPPVAQLNITPQFLTLGFDASGSTDSDGSIASYAWNFGDGTTGTGPTVSHTYSAGTYQVTLTLTDNVGATTTETRTVKPAPNAAPVAAFTATATSPRTLAFNSSGSSDPEGGALTYAWNFGDGTTGTGASPDHTYATAGDYSVTLTVTDPVGASTSTTKSVTAINNQPPVARFTSSMNFRTVSVNGSTSSDADGTVASYAWDFGDGSTGTGATATHAYATGGTYTVKLVVTDNAGATSAPVTASVTAQNAVLLASDDFGRSVSSGFGTAETGGAWSLSGARYAASVTGGAGTVSLTPSSSTDATFGGYLNSVSSSDVDISASFALNNLSSDDTFVYLSGRKVGSTGEYRERVQIRRDGSVRISLARWNSSNTSTNIVDPVTVSGLTYQPGTQLKLRLQVTGTSPTTLKAKVWSAGAAEPANWQVSATNSTSGLQQAGSVGVFAFNTAGETGSRSMVASVDGVRVYRASTLG